MAAALATAPAGLRSTLFVQEGWVPCVASPDHDDDDGRARPAGGRERLRHGLRVGGKTTTLTVVATNYGDSVHKNSIGFWDRVGLAFQAAHPDIRVETKVYPADEVDAKVAALVQQGRAPDVVQTDSYAEYAAKGMLYRAGTSCCRSPPRAASYRASRRPGRCAASSTACRSRRAPACPLLQQGPLPPGGPEAPHHLAATPRGRPRVEGHGRDVPDRAAPRPGGGGGGDPDLAARRGGGYTDNSGSYALTSRRTSPH